MDAVDKLALLAELEYAHCELNHGPDIDNTSFPAVDYITIPIGKSKEKDKHLLIPVCMECLKGLKSDKWVLIYCLECNASKWIYKSLAKLDYVNKSKTLHYHLLGIEGCPECSNKIKNIYYLDTE